MHFSWVSVLLPQLQTEDRLNPRSIVANPCSEKAVVESSNLGHRRGRRKICDNARQYSSAGIDVSQRHRQLLPRTKCLSPSRQTNIHRKDRSTDTQSIGEWPQTEIAPVGSFHIHDRTNQIWIEMEGLRRRAYLSVEASYIRVARIFVPGGARISIGIRCNGEDASAASENGHSSLGCDARKRRQSTRMNWHERICGARIGPLPAGGVSCRNARLDWIESRLQRPTEPKSGDLEVDPGQLTRGFPDAQRQVRFILSRSRHLDQTKRYSGDQNAPT